MKSVFLVDDDPIIAFTLQQIIQIKGFHVNLRHFIKSNEALTFLIDNNSSFPKDAVILLDLNMPQYDGWQFLDLLEKACPSFKPRIIMVSSTMNPSEIHSIEQHPMLENFINKPFTPEQISVILN